MKIAIAGTGYVGLVTAVCLAEKGHHIYCVDVDQDKIDQLKRCIVPIYEKDLEKLMVKNCSNIVYTADYQYAYGQADAIFIAVGTPEREDGSANLKYIYKVADQISESVKRDCVVIVKSTVPIGTNDKLEQYINRRKKNNIDITIASNPEFLSQGTAVGDTIHASRIVIGTEDKKSEEFLLKIYENFDAPKLLMNRRSAEMVKYASNDFLALKISYINEIANLCEEIGADISDVSKGMGLDKRIGESFLNAGIGYGGSCFPKDTKALHWLSNLYDKELKTVKAAIEVNEQQKIRLIKKARKYFPSFDGLTIAVLGLTFKPGTDDLREAPSLKNIAIFIEEGAIVKAWDPVGIQNFKKIYSHEITYCTSIDETISNADVCFIFTEWEEIKKYPLENYNKYMKRPIVFDGRNCYNKIKEKSLTYIPIGKLM